MKLCSTENLRGLEIAATDDTIGTCSDLLIDERDWAIRYLVVDTGHWLPGRKVVLAPAAISHVDPLTPDGAIATRLTRSQVEESPSLDQHAPVSRDLEQQLSTYYGWPAYWGGDTSWAAETTLPGAALPGYADPPSPDPRGTSETKNHLHSAHELANYLNQSADGDLGQLKELLFDPEQWRIHFAVLRTSRWFGGSIRVFPIDWITHIDPLGRTIFTGHTRAEIRHCPQIEAGSLFDEATIAGIQKHFQ